MENCSINTGYKIVQNAVNRLTSFFENLMENYGGGFRRNGSTMDQLFTQRQSFEKWWQMNKAV